MILPTNILQSMIQINADGINWLQRMHIYDKNEAKDAFHLGYKDLHKKYLKTAKAHLRKLHILERNQKFLKQELTEVYWQENMISNTEDYLGYADREWG